MIVWRIDEIERCEFREKMLPLSDTHSFIYQMYLQTGSFKMAYMNGHHKYMYDEENLLYILNAKGFKMFDQEALIPLLTFQRGEF